MQNEYTRQRQGRDFSIPGYLRDAEMSAEGNYTGVPAESKIRWSGSNIDGLIGNNDPKDDTEKKKSLLEHLEQYKAEAERNAAPVDGHEPPERGR